MNRTETGYLNISYGVIVLLLMSFVAFFPAYFRLISTALPWTMHVHAALMFLWMGVLISQPLLIRNGKYWLHQQVGRLSYGLVPLLIASSYAMILYAYDNSIDSISDNGSATLTQEMVRHQARVIMALPFYYFISLIFFYSLGVAYRRDRLVHARYMIATSLTVIGPIVDRFLFHMLSWNQIAIQFPIELVGFLLIDLIILALIVFEMKKRYPVTQAVFILLFFGVGQVLYFTALDSIAWQKVAGWFLAEPA